MAQDQLKAFIEFAKKDEKLLLELASSTADDVVRIANGHGYAITKEDIETAKDEISFAPDEADAEIAEHCLPYHGATSG